MKASPLLLVNLINSSRKKKKRRMKGKNLKDHDGNKELKELK